MQSTNVSDHDIFQVSVPDAMAIVALERQTLHEKIVRLRILREAAEAERTLQSASPLRHRLNLDNSLLS